VSKDITVGGSLLNKTQIGPKARDCTSRLALERREKKKKLSHRAEKSFSLRKKKRMKARKKKSGR